jgi:hypothetical protein
MNPNMPLRGFFYFAAEYQEIVDRHQYNLYGSSRVCLPAPRYVVLCNSEDMDAERETLRLSDLYNRKDKEACLECMAEVININKGHNENILQKSITLSGYAELVALSRKYRESDISEKEAAEKAVDECIGRGILAGYLHKYRMEVIGMILEEYDAEKQRRLDRRDAHAEGYDEGRSAGKTEGKAEGKAEGKVEGKAEGKAEDVLILAGRLGIVPDDIRTGIAAETDETRLTELLMAAAKAETLEDFCRKARDK